MLMRLRGMLDHQARVTGRARRGGYHLETRPATATITVMADFSREAGLSALADVEAQKFRKLRVSKLLVRASRLAFHASMCRANDDLEACWNGILTIFDPHTFLHMA